MSRETALERVRQANRFTRALLLCAEVDEEKVCSALASLEEIERELNDS